MSPRVRGQHLFFATREDLRPGLEMIESQWELEYQLHEMRDDRNFVVLASLLDAPGFGLSKTGQCMSDEGYLVYPRAAFAKTVVRGFHKVHSYWVGPEAYREFRAGKRLATIGVKSPPEYDLAEAR